MSTPQPFEAVHDCFYRGSNHGAPGLVAGNKVRVRSQRGELLFEYDPETERARVSVPSGRLEVDCPGDLVFRSRGTIEFAAERIVAQTGTARFEARSVFVATRGLKLVVGRLESISRTVIRQAQNVYEKVTGLTQLRTGRMRTLVDATYHLKANKANLKATDDVSIDGRQVLLG